MYIIRFLEAHLLQNLSHAKCSITLLVLHIVDHYGMTFRCHVSSFFISKLNPNQMPIIINMDVRILNISPRS
jgi:hypothetical protein